MSSNKKAYDVVSAILGVAVFALPVTILVPGFSISDLIPKIHVQRFHLFNQNLSWSELNVAIIMLLFLFFGIYLEIRKRHLDEIVENVLTVTQATNTVIDEERDRQAEAMRACMQLLDSSVEHYENLVLLHDDLRKRKKLQEPPAVELSSSEF